jgi:AcrR family transcriptional regulator
MSTTLRPSFDVATRVSRALSDVIETLVNDPDREDPPTLEAVRAVLRGYGASGAQSDEFLHPQDETSVLGELDRLIDEYGRDALAMDFVVAKASEGLSRVIQAVIDDITKPRSPTLEAVRKAMLAGLTARLIGDGALDEDDEGALLEEIEYLIQRYGEHAAAEAFLRFE